MLGRRMHGRLTSALALVCIALVGSVRVRLGETETTETRGSIGDMAAVFEDVAGVAVEDIDTAKLMVIHKKLGELWNAIGFAAATEHMMKNSKSLQPCADAGRTIGQCLSDEVARGGHALQEGDKPARLKDPSPAMGLGWTLRVVGFIAEMLEIASRTGVSLYDAGSTAYDDRIGSAFGNCWSCATDIAVNKMVKNAIVSGLPKGAAELTFFEEAGGREAAVADMKTFAETVLPLMDCFLHLVRDDRLDDTKRPQTISACTIQPSTTPIIATTSYEPSSSTSLSSSTDDVGTKGAIGEMAALFDDLSFVSVEDVDTGHLMAIYEKLGDAWNVNSFGSIIDSLLLKNSNEMQPCADAGRTIGQCLSSEASLLYPNDDQTMGGHELQDLNKHAILKDPSPAMGLIWTVRVVGFVAQMFDIASNNCLDNIEIDIAESLHLASSTAFDERIGTAFNNCWHCAADISKSTIMKQAIVSGLHKDLASESWYRVDGREVAVADMKSFAQTVLPLMDCLWHLLRNDGLDDTKRPQPIPACKIRATTTTTTEKAPSPIVPMPIEPSTGGAAAAGGGPSDLVDLTSKFLPDAKTARFEDGITYLCCCKADEESRNISCLLEDANAPHLLWYKQRCGGIMGVHFHSWNTIRDRRLHEGYGHAGECVVPISKLPEWMRSAIVNPF